MRLTIEHETHYRFDAPANHSIQYLRLTPRQDPCQRTVAWRVEAPGRLSAWTDGFDNRCHVSVRDEPHEEVLVRVSGEVETWDTSGVLPADDGLSPLMFMRETPFTGRTGRIAALAAPFGDRRQRDGALDALHALMAAIADAVTYEPGATHVETTAGEALEQGRGVCQDHAHLFIACARTIGVPARYVSGYVLAGGDGERHLDSHAWAEAFISDLGWVSFDPSNRQSATDAYLRLAVAFDYGGAGPIRGLRHGGGDETMNVRVQVERSGE